jgi:nucleotide-binding universal stress UspA family protein
VALAVARAHPPAVAEGFHRVLVPILATPESTHVVEVACRLAAERAHLTALVVVEVSPLLPLDARMDDEEAVAREVLHRAEAVADEYGVRFAGRTERARDAGAAIVELAEEAGCDVVVIGAERRRSPYHRLAGFGRTVRHVLRKAPCRVLLVAS